MTGHDIVTAHAQDALGFTGMGRAGGLNGSDLAEDVRSGRWRSQVYEVRHEPLPGKRKRFAISEFLARTTSSAGVLDDEDPDPLDG